MGGVDRFGHLNNMYAAGRRSNRWWVPIFWWLVNAAITNAWILYNASSRHDSITHLQFVEKVAKGLIGNWSDGDKRAAKASHSHYPTQGDSRDCVWCSDRKNNRRKVTKCICEQCNVNLCWETGCFGDYHRAKNHKRQLGLKQNALLMHAHTSGTSSEMHISTT